MPSPHRCQVKHCDRIEWKVGGIKPNYIVTPTCMYTGESVYNTERCLYE